MEALVTRESQTPTPFFAALDDLVVEGLTDQEMKAVKTMFQRYFKRSRRKSRLLRKEVLDASVMRVRFARQGYVTFCSVGVSSRSGGMIELFGAARFNTEDAKDVVRIDWSDREGDGSAAFKVVRRGRDFSVETGRMIALRRALLDGGEKLDVA